MRWRAAGLPVRSPVASPTRPGHTAGLAPVARRWPIVSRRRRRPRSRRRRRGPLPSAQLVARGAACEPRVTRPVTWLAPHDTTRSQPHRRPSTRRHGGRDASVRRQHRTRDMDDAARAATLMPDVPRRSWRRPRSGQPSHRRPLLGHTRHDVRSPDNVGMLQSRRLALERRVGRLSPDPRVGCFSNRGCHPSLDHGTVPQSRAVLVAALRNSGFALVKRSLARTTGHRT